MNTETDPSNDRLAYAVQSLIQSCNQSNNGNGVCNVPGFGGPLEFTYVIHSDPNPDKRSFVKFLQVHTNHAFVKGFDDNIGRSTTKAHFEMPSVDSWFEVANKLFEYFCGDNDLVLSDEGYEKYPKTVDRSPIARGLLALNIDTRFSEQRCLKVLPLALARYQETLPPHYTRAFHENRVRFFVEAIL